MRKILFLLVVTAEVLAASADSAFLFMGDSGTARPEQAAVGQAAGKLCAEKRCDFVAQLGDNFYPAGVSSVDDPQWQTKFEIPFKDISAVFRVALGNHDHDGVAQAQIDYSAKSKRWSLPARYYAFQENGVDFFVLDTTKFDGVQATWLRKALAASVSDWRVVYGHHPIYSYGTHGDEKERIADLLPLLKQAKVDFYIAGHDHDKQVLKSDGIHFLIAGTGGVELRPSKGGPKSVFNKSTYGFGHLKISGDSALVRYFDTEGKEEFRLEVGKKALARRAWKRQPR